MRIPSSVFGVGRYAVALLAVTGSVVLMSAPKKTNLTVHDKAYYADANTIQFVRPGLNITIVSAKIAADGTTSVDFKVTDTPPSGTAAQPLDIQGVNTPGPISVSFLIAYIPKGQEQFVSYISRVVSAVTGGATATQASGESMTTGVLQTVTQGEYIYTFKAKAPAGFDPTLTHRAAVYGSRNLTEFDLGTNYGTSTFDFVPAGGTPNPRDVVRDPDCNRCHDSLAFHGGSRVGVAICIMCHTPQSADPNSGNTVDMKVMIHKIHMGQNLPSVKAGGKYQIYGHSGYSDFSDVTYPANPYDPRDCAGTCHNPKNGAAQTSVWLTTPTRAACGSCHDDVNFATGLNHVNLPEVTDNLCAGCHIPQSGQEFDASILGAHANPTESAAAPGINLAITQVANGTAGKKPTVTFTIKDNSGAAIPMSAMTGGSNRMALVMAGPTTDYGYTSFGSDVTTPGYVSENPVPTASCGADGTCAYTFTHAIPATATGTYAIGIEGRRGITINPNTTIAQTSEYGAINKVFYFSVDGTPVVPRRTVVSLTNCNGCHVKLSLHGENRNQIEMCVLCHNPSENDISQRPSATVAADKAAPPQGVDFDYMIHRIHLGDNMASMGASYIVVGFGGSHNDFSDVTYPSMSPTGSTGNVQACYMCHVNGSESVLPIGLNAVTNPSAKLSPAGAVTTACTACHAQNSVFAHALSNTDPKFGESCDVCHGTGAAYSATQVHAQ